MTRKIFAMILAVMLLMTMSAAFAGETAVTVTDMTGRELTFTEPVTRIVALTAADCEIIFALGAGDAIVGRGEYCDYPEEVLEKPVVVSGAETNIEQILALEPQVVVMSAMAQTKEQVQALENAGVTVVVSDAQNIADVYTAIAMLGTMLGKTAEAGTLVSGMQAAFDSIIAASASSEAAGKTVYFEASPLEYGLWTGGSGTFMDELAAMCGLTNIFADVEGWAEVSEEQVIARNPDYIVSTAMYFDEGPTPVEEILGRTGWESVTAIANGDVFNANNDEVTRPGPRLTNAAVSLYSFFNGVETAE